MGKTEEELKKIEKEIIEFEKRGLEGILNYFDRVHDKLFNFNTMLIAAYCSLFSPFSFQRLFKVDYSYSICKHGSYFNY